MKKALLSVFIISALLAGVSSCRQWKVSSLKQKELLFIENGGNAGNAAIKFDEYALTDFSFGIGVFNGKVFVADNVMKRVQIIDPGGKVDLVIGELKNIDTKKITSAPFNFSTIGSFTVDRNDNIYVQNRFP